MGSYASALHRYGVCFAMASNEIDSFANELSTRQIMHVPSRITREIQFSRRKKDTLKGKNLWDSNSWIRPLGFQLRNLPGIVKFGNARNRDVDRSTTCKPAVAVLVMPLPIN